MSQISTHQTLSRVKKCGSGLLVILHRQKLTIGFESNIAKNEVRKRNKYKNLTQSLKSKYGQVKYINLSSGACGIIGKCSKPFFDLLEELKFLITKDISQCMIKIFRRGGRGGDTFKTRSPLRNNF